MRRLGSYDCERCGNLKLEEALAIIDELTIIMSLVFLFRPRTTLSGALQLWDHLCIGLFERPTASLRRECSSQPLLLLSLCVRCWFVRAFRRPPPPLLLCLLACHAWHRQKGARTNAPQRSHKHEQRSTCPLWQTTARRHFHPSSVDTHPSGWTGHDPRSRRRAPLLSPSMGRRWRLACHAAMLFVAYASRVSPVQAAPEVFAIQLDAGSPIATSLSDEGDMITHALAGRYTCNSLAGPNCLITNGHSDTLIPAAALTEMLRQVLASTVKAKAKSPADASATAATSASAANTGSNAQHTPASSSSSDLDDEIARTRRAAAAARPIASTSGVPFDDENGGEVLYDDELDAHDLQALFDGRTQQQGGQPMSEKGAEVLRKVLERAAAAADKAAATAANKDAANPGHTEGKGDAAASSSSLGGVRNLLSSLFDSGDGAVDDDGEGYYGDEDAGYEVEIDGQVHVLSAAEFQQFMAEHPWVEMQHDEQEEEEELRRHDSGRGRQRPRRP